MNLFGSLGFAWQTSSDNCIISYNLRVCAHLGTVLYSSRREQDHKPLLCYPTSSYCTRLVFFFWQSCQRQRKNPRQRWKNRKMCWGARNELTDSCQNYVLYQGRSLYTWKETSYFTLCMANFGFTVTSLIEIWIPAGTGRFHKGTFSFLDRMVLFLSSLALVFFFLPRACSPFWFFHEQRFFHRQGASRCEFCWVCGEYHKIRAQFQIKEKSIFSAIEDGK